MIDYFIPIIGSVVSSQLWPYLFIPILSLFFVATVPCIVRKFITIWGR